MIPAELTPRKILLPEKNTCKIVIFTGNALRHDRFALRMQQEFGERVVGWYQIVPREQPRRARDLQRLVSMGKESLRSPRRLVQTARYLKQRVEQSLSIRRSQYYQRYYQELLLGEEVRLLRETAHLQPTVISNPNAPEIIDQVKSLDPYLILTLGGVIYKKPLLECARGLALNQHDGWCPEYKGVATVDWALYRRDLTHIGNTVHILTSGMDAGPILRRSTACTLGDDRRESCFIRSVVLGNELFCEVVNEIIKSDEINVYDQPNGAGFTYLHDHLTNKIRSTIERDIRKGWIPLELARQRRF